MTTSLYKFGGTSVGDANSIHTAAELVRDASANSTLCVVTSAMAGVTNLLVTLSADGTTLEARTELFDTLAAKHRDTAHALGMIDTSRLDQLLDEIRVLYEGMALTRVGSRRMRDRLIAGGERLSVELLAHALGTHGVKAAPMHADTFLETEGGFSEVEPRSFTQDRRTQAALRRVIDRGEIPIVTGFSGRGPDGDTRLLGRGGSDLTATLLASALDADECVIWTDVPGVSTCDPRLVPDALPIEHLHYREASEMAFFGVEGAAPAHDDPSRDQGHPRRGALNQGPQRRLYAHRRLARNAPRDTSERLRAP